MVNTAKVLRVLTGQFSQVATFMSFGLLQHQRLASTLACATLVGLVGCSPTSDRLSLSGSVSLNATPLDRGSIRFSSSEGQKLVATGALIRDGHYHVPQEKGLPPGRYRVEISSPDVSAPPVLVRDGPGTAGIPAAPERVPPQYNVNSQQSIEVSADGDNRFDFDIVAK